MNGFELVVLGCALSMDSFATAVTKGIEFNQLTIKKMVIVALWFSVFQSMMPILGYLLSNLFSSFLFAIDHFLSFFVLSYLGINMIRSRNEEKLMNECLDIKTMVLLSVAISIDAFTVGITYSILSVCLPLATFITFTITFITTILGVKIGNIFGSMLNEKALVFGGLVLISLGIKILLTHLGIF